MLFCELPRDNCATAVQKKRRSFDMFALILFFVLLAASVFLSPAVALFAGIVYALIFGTPYSTVSGKAAKYLLQLSVIGLGFGMNIEESLRSSWEGMAMTVVSVGSVMVLGYYLGRWLGVERKLSHLISSGTAICGGSAIAAIAPVVKSDAQQTSMAMAVIFTLNAVALFVFPSIGHLLDLSQDDFGLWAAIAIHDTSSVVGAGAAYGEQALIVATTVKLTRALWIIPLALVSTFMFRDRTTGSRSPISVPWFIFLFIVAMVINTYMPLGERLGQWISIFSHKALSVTLFLIGSSLSIQAIRHVGARPVVLGVSLWVVVSVVSLLAILYL